MPRKRKEYPDQSTLKRLLSYDPETGVFTRLATSNGRRLSSERLGRPAGSIKGTTGYLVINIGKQTYYAHRLAFLYMQGSIPEYVDHADQCRSNNVWANLRACTHSENLANRGVQSNCKSGRKGVYRCHKSPRWVAQITVRGKQIKIGSYATVEEAAQAYSDASTQYFGEFAKC